jgi:hypothetical protein
LFLPFKNFTTLDIAGCLEARPKVKKLGAKLAQSRMAPFYALMREGESNDQFFSSGI